MGYACKILKDSITNDDCRLTTFEVTFPRIVLAEFNTHRMLSRNSASSRAIPVLKRIAAVEADPFIPESFGKNQKGMQAGEVLDERETRMAREVWLKAAADAVAGARALAETGVHKQLANRLLEPFLWHTVIVSATEWENFFALRCHEAAQPEIRKPAEMMKRLLNESTPTKLRYGQWHTPFLDEDEAVQLIQMSGFSPNELLLVAIGRCAAVTYLNHDTGKRDPRADADRAVRLRTAGHMSPLEHVAQAVPQPVNDQRAFIGNFAGFRQYRKTVPHEDNFAGIVGALS